MVAMTYMGRPVLETCEDRVRDGYLLKLQGEDGFEAVFLPRWIYLEAYWPSVSLVRSAADAEPVQAARPSRLAVFRKYGGGGYRALDSEVPRE